MPWSGPFFELTSHFLGGLLRPRLLDESGNEGLHRVMLGAVAGFITVGLLLVRIFAVKYAALSAEAGPEPYQAALLADTAFVLAVPMLIVAVLTTLHGQGLFPNDTDFRVLMVLPLRRSLVFQAKLTALLLCVGGWSIALYAAVTPLLLLMWSSRWASEPVLLRLPVFALAGAAAIATTAMTIIALHALALIGLPRSWRQAGSSVMSSALLLFIVLMVPFAIRLSGLSEAIAGRAPFTSAVPPLWFVGIEQSMLGNGTPRFAALSTYGVWALALSTTFAAGAYAVLYRRFDQAIVSAARAHTKPSTSRWWLPSWRLPRSQAYAAVRGFASATLWRSPLHQRVFTGLSACGAGIVVHQALSTEQAVAGVPFVLVLVTSVSLRYTLALPHARQASWVFRQTERDNSRAQQLQAAEGLMWRLGVIGPVGVAALVQWTLGGEHLLPSVVVVLAFGWLLIELLLRDWQRIPFTCSYIPGRRMVAQTVFIALHGYLAFTIVGPALARATATALLPVGGTLAAVVIVAAVMRWQRLRRWQAVPLTFDAELDERPSSVVGSPL